MERVSEGHGESYAARHRRRGRPQPRPIEPIQPVEVPAPQMASEPPPPPLVEAPRSLASALLRPVLTLAALPMVYAVSAAYWLVAAGIIERRLAPSTVRAERG